ncbi:MAG: response regulator [Hyphomicrobium sp.]
MTDSEKLRILVIDDEITQRMLVKDFLEDAGHVVRQAEDGRRGLKMAGVTKPDVILLDVLLPLMDGYAVCKKFKEDPETADTPVILITASRETDVIERGLAVGADDFVTKPVDWTFLADRVVNVVRKARERAAMARQIRERSQVAAPQTDAPPTAQLEAQLDELMRSAEQQIAEANEATVKERRRLEVEYAAALNGAVEQAKAGRDAEISELRAQHDKEIKDLRERYELEITTIRGSARHEVLVAERRNAAELEAARAALADAKSNVENRIAVIRSAIETECAGQAQAIWSLVQRWVTHQANLASCIIAEAKPALSSAGAGNLQEIERSAKTMAAACSKLKIVAQAMTTPNDRPAKPVHLGPLLTEIAKQAEGVAKSRRVEVNCRAHNGEAALQVDADRLRYALLSLVGNAIRFTPAGGAVDLNLSQSDNGDVRIDIVDTGVGIAPAKLNYLRACLDEPTRYEDSDGAALGLGIPAATALIRKMGGKLVLQSQIGAGTQASVVFPDAVDQYQAPVSELLFAG